MNTYALSKDYELLYDLAKAGHELAGYVTDDTTKKLNGMKRLVCIKWSRASGSIMITARGVDYTGMQESKDEFIRLCNDLKLEYIQLSAQALESFGNSAGNNT
jgi:hypothetical protein